MVGAGDIVASFWSWVGDVSGMFGIVRTWFGHVRAMNWACFAHDVDMVGMFCFQHDMGMCLV